MVRPSKQFKKFASSGKLKDTIKSRRQHQQIRRKADERDTRRAKQRGPPKLDGDDEAADDDGADDDEAREASKLSRNAGGRAAGVAKTVEELFGGKIDGGEEGSDLEDLDDDEDEDGEGQGEVDGDGDLVMEERAMEKAMKDLEKKDPEFFKYLRENDRDLLDFGAEAVRVQGTGKAVEDVDDVEMDEEAKEDGGEEDAEEDDEDMDEAPKKTSVTINMLKQWQAGMLRQSSVGSLRKLLLAFRAAAHMNEDDADQGSGRDTKYTIDSAKVFNKIVLTALKFTPTVIAAHMPFKTQPNGKIKLLQIKKPNASLNRLVLSHFSTLMYLMRSLPAAPANSATDEDAGGLLLVAVGESSKLLPWIIGARKHVRGYLKVLLELWSSSSDSVRIAAFLAFRKLFIAGDDAIKDLCLRNTYRSLLPPLRHTTVHTLPSINLMKNTASDLFHLEPQRSYTHAFTFIRMLAVHLRNVVRSSTTGKSGENQEAFRSVYNWQYVHCIDFWTQVLGASADVDTERDSGGAESPLRALIYPLTQIALGVVRLLPSSRYFPLRFHILRSLLRIVARTNTYIPLSPFLLEILDSAEFRRSDPKKGTLKPLDLEYIIRAPAAYPKTRIYQETLAEELIFLLGEYHSLLSTNIAFPELALPVIVTIRKHLKKGTAGTPKVQGQFKVLVEKLEGTRVWVEGKRRNVSFAPKDTAEVGRFCEGVGVEVTPIGGWVRVQRKAREGRRKEVERALREEKGDEEEEE